MNHPTLESLRRVVVARSLRVHASIEAAVSSLGFVQADPIRAPARAQDLILRHRVAGYHAGDLERAYPDLGLAEDVLHVYGFMPEELRVLVHPRSGPYRWRVEMQHPRLRSRVVQFIRDNGPAHPRDLERAVGKGAVVNGWGGMSSATTRMLEALHHKGVLRVARREGGIRIYDLAAPLPERLAPKLRAEGLLRLLAGIYAPLPEASLRKLLGMLGDRAPSRCDPRDSIAQLVKRGELRRDLVDGSAWIALAEETITAAPEDSVRFLAPFDPIVWDRSRFELLWGWQYRFEAYTPQAKRKLGYYALPLLWRDRIIGWANAEARNGSLEVKPGFVASKPRERAFHSEFSREVERLKAFLGPS